MAYSDLYNVGWNQDFTNMVKMAIIKKANALATEVAGETPQIIVDKRRALAAQIFASADQEAKKFSFHVASQGGNAITVVNGELTHEIANIDLAIDSLVNSIFDIRAGVTPEDSAV